MFSSGASSPPVQPVVLQLLICMHVMEVDPFSVNIILESYAMRAVHAVGKLSTLDASLVVMFHI